jgi:hypothetical protein
MSKPILTPEMRVIAQRLAAAVPLTSAREIRATGNHRTAQNDEPEPGEVPSWKDQRERLEAQAHLREIEQLVRDGRLK